MVDCYILAAAIFLMLRAMQCKPHSSLTFSYPLRINRRMPKLPLISSKTLSTSIGLELRIFSPYSLVRLARASALSSLPLRLM